MSEKSTSVQIARCSCGGLTAELRAEPVELYLCSCKVCQERSGSTFSYAAIYPEANVTVQGEHRGWRRLGESERWIENHFCPTCGVAVFFYGEGLAGLIGIPVGTLADPDFPKPRRVYWASRKHRWLDLPGTIEHLDTQ